MDFVLQLGAHHKPISKTVVLGTRISIQAYDLQAKRHKY